MNKKAVIFLVFMVILAVIMFLPEEEETTAIDTAQLLYDSAWENEEGNEVILFTQFGDFYVSAKRKGVWGRYIITDTNDIVIEANDDVVPLPYAGEREIKVSEKELVFDGTRYGKTDFEAWLDRAMRQ